MFSKVNLTSTVFTALWGFFGGYLLWGIIADPILMNHIGSANLNMKEIPDFMFLAIGCVLVGFFFSTLYSKLSDPRNSISKGAEIGVLVGALLGFGSGIIDFSTMGILDLIGTLINGVVYIVHFMIIGTIASIVYKRMS